MDISKELVRGAVARVSVSSVVSRKDMDVVLGEAITEEVVELLKSCEPRVAIRIDGERRENEGEKRD